MTDPILKDISFQSHGDVEIQNHIFKVLESKSKAIEEILQKKVGDIPLGQLGKRLTCHVYQHGNIEEYFLDGKLIIRVSWIPEEIKWQIKYWE
jgi:hypothetical protein